MKWSLLIIGILVIIIILIGIFLYHNLNREEVISPELKITMPEKVLVNKKIVMIIAFRDFRDAEYFVPKGILETAGAEIKTVSNKKGTAIGADGGDVDIDLLVSEINPANFDAIVFVGGPGCLENLDNENSYKVVRETVFQGKILASICISPVILARAGVLEGKKATVWSSPMDRSPVKILKENGVIYEDKPVVVDGKIITGNGPSAAEDFAKVIIEALKEK